METKRVDLRDLGADPFGNGNCQMDDQGNTQLGLGMIDQKRCARSEIGKSKENGRAYLGRPSSQAIRSAHAYCHHSEMEVWWYADATIIL